VSIPTRNFSGVIGYGLLSARPTAAHEGHLYYSSDIKTLSRDNGTTWDDLTSAPITVNATDPGATGAFSFWLDISTPATPLLKTRNATDTAWIVLSPDLSPYMLASAITANQLAALAGTGTPSGTDKYVNNSDSRMTNARTPSSTLAHESTHLAAGSDPLSGLSPSQITGTAVVTGDSRLSDARTPTAHASTHNHGGSDALAEDAVAATGSLRTLGTGAQQAAAGNHGHSTTTGFTLFWDQGGVPVTTGRKLACRAPTAFTIASWTLDGNVTGSISLTIKVNGASIVASAHPSFTSALTATSSTLTGWTTAINAGDLIEVFVDSAATLTNFALSITDTRTF